MFGLLKKLECSSTNSLGLRKHYCGVCKTMGSDYGQLSRFSLNSDIAFLSRLLFEVSNNESGLNLDDFSSPQFCFSSINKGKSVPAYLQYASAINIVLAKLLLEDKVKDNGKYWYKLTDQFFQDKYGKAIQFLVEANFPINELKKWTDIQDEREQNIEEYQDLRQDELLDRFAEPTATITGITFFEGAKIVNNKKEADIMYQVGYNFGKLIYVIDALDDYKEDIKHDEFNAIGYAYNIRDKELPENIRFELIEIIQNITHEIANNIGQLAIKAETSKLFVKAIELNISQKGYAPPSGQHITEDLLNQDLPLFKKWEYAKEIARLTVKKQLDSNTFRERVSAYSVTAVFTLIIFFTSEENIEAKYQRAGIEWYYIVGGLCAFGILGALFDGLKKFYSLSKIENDCKNECFILVLFRYTLCFPICCFVESCCMDASVSDAVGRMGKEQRRKEEEEEEEEE